MTSTIFSTYFSAKESAYERIYFKSAKKDKGVTRVRHEG
jgi:hypothetical protein